MKLARGWFGTDLGPYRCDDGTYDHVPAESLPPLPEPLFDGRFAWLAGARDPRVAYMRPIDARADKALLGAGLPDPFVEFMGRPELSGAVPSCTACWWQWPARPVPSPVGAGARLLRFLNDQQDCLFWYLYLEPDGGHRVLAGGINYDTWAEDGIDETDAAGDLVEVAPDFERFVYRFWVENLAWFEVVGQERDWDDLSPPVQDYLAHYRAAAVGS
ncbi:hypothetical protein [Polymorphospora rubra]|uniref:hypothetical protein n=1 Tax=Polymorphospora rubra TaxID=338584 RepID=UPI0031DAA150